MSARRCRRAVVLALSALVVLSVVPGIAAAQSGAGGTVVVEEGETVSQVNALAGTVIVRGTVTGDVSALAGDVRIEGTVEGDVSVAGGNLHVPGTVEGDVSAGAGNVYVEDTGLVGGNFQVGAGSVRIDGTIRGDAVIGADTIRLGEDATVEGSLTYDGSLVGNRDAVAGEIVRDRTLGVGFAVDFSPLGSILWAGYTFVLNLLLGAALLLLFPGFSRGVAEQVVADPLRTGLVGLGILVVVPILLVMLAITIVGIPLSLAGALLFGLVVWVGIVYGRFAVGAWLVSLADGESRWLALVVGLLVGAVLSFVPVVGDLVNLLIFLLGLGALSVGFYARSRRDRKASTAARGEQTLVE